MGQTARAQRLLHRLPRLPSAHRKDIQTSNDLLRQIRKRVTALRAVQSRPAATRQRQATASVKTPIREHKRHDT